MRALIGYSGFVGSTLLRAGRYDCLYNTSNSNQMRNNHFSEVICAGVSAVKWKANKEPQSDFSALMALRDNLAQIKADRFILVSTIDVYDPPVNVTEDDPANINGNPYGAHRALLETWVRGQFPRTHIVRLPGLYGTGLKKNALFDLIHNNEVYKIDPAGVYQWYDVSRLAEDLEIIVSQECRVCNVVSEPIRVADVASRFFPNAVLAGRASGHSPRYDVRTKYDALLGGSNGYHFSTKQVFAGIEKFLQSFQ